MGQEAGNELLGPAEAAGAIRRGLAVDDFLALINAISLNAGPSADTDQAERLLTIALDGIHPRERPRTNAERPAR